MWIIWDSIMLVFLASSYSYIIMTVIARKKKLGTNAAHSSRKQFKYHIPLMIVLSFAILVLVPTLVVAVDLKYYTAWIDFAFKLNYTVDAFIYLLHSRRIYGQTNRQGNSSSATNASSVVSNSYAGSNVRQVASTSL